MKNKADLAYGYGDIILLLLNWMKLENELKKKVGRVVITSQAIKIYDSKNKLFFTVKDNSEERDLP